MKQSFGPSHMAGKPLLKSNLFKCTDGGKIKSELQVHGIDFDTSSGLHLNLTSPHINNAILSFATPSSKSSLPIVDGNNSSYRLWWK